MASVPQSRLNLPTIVLSLAIVVATAVGVHAATATWDANTEPDLAGYILSYGTQSGVHTVVIDVGRVTTYTFNPPAGRYYVVVQAYNTSGGISDKSAEVVVDIAPGPPVSGVPTPIVQPPVSPAPNPPSSPTPPVLQPPPPPVLQPAPPPPVLQPAPPPPVPVIPMPLRMVQPSNQTTKVNTGVVLAVNASHLENKPMTFTATGLPPGLSIDGSTGVISGTPHTIGFYRVGLTVSEGPFTIGGDFNWAVVDTLPSTGPNRPPAVQQPSDLKTALNETVALVIPASDPENRPLTFSATGLPPDLSINSSTGVITGTANTLGLYNVTVTVSDGELASSVSFRWAVVQLTALEATSGKATSSASSVRAALDRAAAEDYVDVSGDFDGDGRNDLATYRRSTSEWRIWTSGSKFAEPTVFAWGDAGDRPVAADYNGDRVTDFAVYRPSTGTWHISLSGSRTSLALHWGGPEDTPVPLDHDGDGKADLALIRDGGYEILLSSANYLKSVRVF